MVIINIFLYTGIDKSLSDYPLILILIAVTAAVAFLSYRIVEKPALKLRSIKDKQTSKTKDCELMAKGCSYVGSPNSIPSLHKRANLSREIPKQMTPTEILILNQLLFWSKVFLTAPSAILKNP